MDSTISIPFGKDASGTALLFADIVQPVMQCMSLLLTAKPRHLVVSPDVSIDDAPFRINFVGYEVDNWESSSLERLDLLTVEQRFTHIRYVSWLVTL